MSMVRGSRGAAAPYGWMLCSALAFALMGAMAHAAGELADWHLVALMRTALALAFSLAWAKAAGVSLVVFRPLTLWLRSFAGSISLLCTFYALTHLPVADAMTLTNMFPLWVALISWPMLGKRPSAVAWVAVLCGVVGVHLIHRPSLNENNVAVGAAVTASFSTALAMLGLHRLKALDPRAIVVHFSAVGTCFTLAAFLASGTRVPSLTENAMAWLLLFGVGVTATVGQFTMTRAFAMGQPAGVSVVGLTQIVFALGFDLVVWQRPLELAALTGIGLIMGPTAWLMLRGETSAGGPRPSSSPVTHTSVESVDACRELPPMVECVERAAT